MNKIAFKINNHNLTIELLKKDIKEDLNNTNIINTKEIYFTSTYIKENLELVSSFLNVIILKQNVNKATINDYAIINLGLSIINLIPSIKDLYIVPDKSITYDMFLQILDNKYLDELNVYDIPNYLLERLDINKNLSVTIRCEILFVSTFMETNKLNTYTDIFYKKSISINQNFDNSDKHDFITFLIINNYLKQIEFNFLDEKIFKYVMDNIFKYKKEDIRFIFNEEFICLNNIVDIVNDYKNKNEKKLNESNLSFKIKYSDEYKKNNTFKQINLNVVKITLISIIIVVAFMMAINIYRNYTDNEKTDKITNNIDTIIQNRNDEHEINNNTIEFISPNSDDKKIINATTTSIYDIKYKQIYEELLKINKDTIGWLKVNNTNIDYPVVVSTDNDYYLKRDYYQNKNRHGWIFMDYRNNIDYLNKNTIIYGHNLANQKMFGTLRYVLNSKWYKNKNNQIITFNSVNKNMKWQIFSIYKIPVSIDYLSTSFNSNEAFQNFINMIKNRSIYNFNVDVTVNDNILTLSTCSNGNDQRLVVHAKLIKE